MQNHVFDEHTDTLQIYWSTKDVIAWLAANSDDEHLKKIKQNAERHAAAMEITSRSVHDEKALFDEDEAEDEVVLGRKEAAGPETSTQRLLSMNKIKPEFEGLRTTASGHLIQDIKELQSVPVRPFVPCLFIKCSLSMQVIVTADLTKSPPVIKVYSVNPYAHERK